MRQQFPAWYWNIALVGWLVFAAAPFITAIFSPEVQKTLAMVCLGIGVLTAAWGFWVCPWLDTRNPSPKWRYEPKVRMRNLRLMFFAPAIITFFCWGITTLTILERAMTIEFDGFEAIHLLWLALLVAIAPMALLGLHLSKVCQRLLAEACFKRHICYNCAYDLAGNPDACSCPECGATIPYHVRPIFQRRARETMRYRHLVREFELRGIRVRPHRNMAMA